jgi:hypothetical protein
LSSLHVKHRFGFVAIFFISLTVIVSLLMPARVHAGASAVVEPDTGIVGTPVTIKGENFTGTLAVLHWDGEVVAEDIPISEEGTVSFDYVIPSAGRGEHTIFISDDTNWSGSTATVVFNVLPHIEIFPRAGKEATLITVTGKGFDNNEMNITITWDGNIFPISPIKADKYGTWYATITIPGDSAGERLIGAWGSTTTADEVDEVTLIVAPWLTIEPTSGIVGTKVSVTGWGFRLNELGITTTWDEEPVKMDIRPLADGSIKEEFIVPASTRGYHTVSVFGKLYTIKGDLPEFEFEVKPSIKVAPETGKRGTKVTITGAGFAANEKTVITFDDKVADTVTADMQGSFRAVITVPWTQVKEHEITADGGEGSFVRADFLTEAMSSPVPVLKIPPGDSVYAVFGSLVDVFFHGFPYIIGKDIGPPALIFEWSDVGVGKEVKYEIQIATDTSFATPVLEKVVSGDSEYPLSDADQLEQGTYVWRVKAVDSLGNESPWSEMSQFEIEVMPQKVLIFTCVILALLLAMLILIGIMVWNRVTRIR